MVDEGLIIDLVPGVDFRDSPDGDNASSELVQTPLPKGLRDLTTDLGKVGEQIEAHGNTRPRLRQGEEFDKWNSERSDLLGKSKELTTAIDGRKQHIADEITHKIFDYDPQGDRVIVKPDTLKDRSKLIAEGVHPDWVNADSEGRLDPNTSMFVATMAGNERIATYEIPEATRQTSGFDSEAIDYLKFVQGETRRTIEYLPKSLDFLKPPSDGMVAPHLRLRSDYKSEEHRGNSPTIVERHKLWVKISKDLNSFKSGRRPKR